MTATRPSSGPPSSAPPSAPPLLIALAWARAREIIAACPCDTGREPSPAEIADAIAIRYPDDAACGPCALHEDAREASP